jgi:formiminotetrahydrofolate cyclodeaminase
MGSPSKAKFRAGGELRSVASLEYYLETLASAAPTPGGGSAATIVGAMAASLVAMVARITADNPKFADHLAEASLIVIHADGLRGKLLDARAADERAYGEVVTAMALPRASDDEKRVRTERLQAALAEAARVPLESAATVCAILALATRARAFNNANLMSDVECAAAFGRAALEACAANVRVNHRYLKDATLIESQERELADLERRGAEAYGDAIGV